MNKKEDRIRLAIPTIDLLECRKFKGGMNYGEAYWTHHIAMQMVRTTIILMQMMVGYRNLTL